MRIMKLEDVLPYKNCTEYISAIFCYKDSRGQQHSVLNQYIYPYRKELMGAQNVVLFLDANKNITGGQIGLYNSEHGLHVEFFTETQEEKG